MRPATDRRGASTGRGRRVVALTAAPLVGFFGAAALVSLTATPAIAGPTVAAYGPTGDGLTRYVVASHSGPITNGQLAALRSTVGVESAQMLSGGKALVATSGVTAARLDQAAPGLTASPSQQSQVTGTAVSDPSWSSYGWNLSNTGSNAYQQTATAGADVAAPAGWQTSTGRGLIVAVVDTGMADVADLQGALWSNPNESCGTIDTDKDGYVGDCHGWNFYSNNADVTNSTGDDTHGTAVAGVAAARMGNGIGSAGVAPDVQIMPLVIGTGTSVDPILGAQAIRYAADHGAAVVNASWIGSGGSAELTDAIAYAATKGTVVVAAAGNDSLDRDTSLLYPASLTAPNLIKVGASTANDSVSSFSAYGSKTVDIFAPGTLVYTTWNDGSYRLVNGTSIAAPQVAAAVALYRAHLPSASAADIKSALLADASPQPAFAGKSTTGGRLSLTNLGGQTTPVQYTFTAMTAPAPGIVTPSVNISAAAGGGTFSVTLGLGEEYKGEVMALADQPLRFADGTTLTTGADGMVTVPLGSASTFSSTTLQPSTTLQNGRYVLVAQLVKDGVATTQPYAAPLLVGPQAIATPVPTAPSSNPGTPSAAPSVPSGSQPSGSAPSAPAQPTTGVSAAPSTPVPATSSSPAPTAQPSQGGTGPVTPVQPPTPVVVPPSQPSSAPVPGSTSPTASPSPTVPSVPGQPDPGSVPAPSSGPAPASSTGGPGTAKTYPPTGAFQLTSIDPSVVSTAGGTQVTVTGNAIPAGARVRIGLNDAAPVTSSSANSVTFTAPSLIAGSYDVYIFSADGSTYSVLPGGLTYEANPSSQPGQASPTTAPSSAASSAPSAPSSASPSQGNTGPTNPVQNPNAPAPTPAPPTNSYTAGPNGEHLYHSALFGSLPSTVWGQSCVNGCSGLQL